MNRIDDLKKRKNLISIEIQPPKLGENINQLYEFLDDIVKLGIKYVDITYHPEQIIGHYFYKGKRFPKTVRKKPGTAGVAGAIIGRYKNKVQPVPHVICTGFDEYSTEEYLVELNYLGVENILALRGDYPKDKYGKPINSSFSPSANNHATDLIEQIINLRKGIYVGAENGIPIKFCIGAACYPEIHPETKSLKQEIYWTKRKVEVGAEYLITQMFFDNNKYFEFVEKSNLNVPIIPGIKPLINYNNILSLPKIFNCEIPKKLIEQVEKHKCNKEDVKKIGIEWAVEQCIDLMKNSPGIHLYETNPKEGSVKKVIKNMT